MCTVCLERPLCEPVIVKRQVQQRLQDPGGAQDQGTAIKQSCYRGEMGPPKPKAGLSATRDGVQGCRGTGVQGWDSPRPLEPRA